MIRWIPLLVLLAACASPGETTSDPWLALTVAPAAPVPGEAVTLTLSNQTAWPVGYNLCTSWLERDSAGTWEPVPEDRVCTMELRMLDPGGESQDQVQLPATLSAGSYRYTARVEDRGSMEDVSSEPFQIR
jgi:hypothetical protein